MKSALSTVAVVLLLAGCGGGGGSSAVSPSNSAGAVGGLSATVNVTIPQGSTVTATPSTSLFSTIRSSSGTRKGLYLTSYTQGIDLQAVQNGVASGYVFYPLSALQSNCTAISTGYTCSLKVTVPSGNSQLVVNTYDGQQKAGSNVLSTSTTSITASTSATAFSVQTLPIVANINAFNNQQSFQCPIIGSSSTVTSAYTTTDADNGVLSGTLGSPFSASNTDQTGSVTFSPGPFTMATGTFTMTYNGGVPTNGVAIISGVSSTINAQGVANGIVGYGSITPIRATPAGPHYVYVTDQANNAVYPINVCNGNNNGVNTSISLPGGTGPTEAVFDRYDWNVSNSVQHLVVMGSGNSTLVVVDAVAGTVLQTVTLPGVPHRMQSTGADASGNSLFVTVDPNKLLKYGLHATSPYLTGPTTITVGNAPRGFNLEGFGNDAFVADSTDGTVKAINPSSGAVDATLSIGVTPYGIPGPSNDGLCTLVIDQGNNTVSALKVNAAGTATISQIGAPIALPGQPQSATFFPYSNTAIVTTTSGGAILVTCAGGTSFTKTSAWTSFMSNPVANIPSQYVYPASGPGAALLAANATSVFVVGSNNGAAVLQAYNVGQNVPLSTTTLGSGISPGGVVVGP